MDFDGSKIKQIAGEKNISMYSLAKGAGLTQATLSCIVNSKTKRPREKTLIAIADFLGVDPIELGAEKRVSKPIVERGPYVPVYSPRALACAVLNIEIYEAPHLIAYPYSETEDVDEILLSDYPSLSESELACLQVTGNAAEPIYKQGDLIFLKMSELEQAAFYGRDFIGVCLLGEKGKEYAAVRKIVINEDGSGNYWAEPINPKYPDQTKIQNPRVVGDIIGFLGRPREI